MKPLPRYRRLPRLEADLVRCRDCPRLVSWREEVARTKRAAYREQEYWGRPVPGFGDPQAKLLVMGLAPAAHGANRTGRMFTGDRSGDWLYGGLHRAGYGNQASSIARDDGLELKGAWVTSAVHCAPPDNRPSPKERDACLRWTSRELRLLSSARVILCLGAFAWDGALRLLAELGHTQRPRPKFGHGSEAELGPYRLLGCYHVSQQNTFTGRLTEPMLDAIFARARELSEAPSA